MKTVLIVEDEKMIRQGIKTMVQRSGVPVDIIMECNNGETALDIIREQEIDVMFTDIRMPKMDGITLVKEMQKCEHLPLTVAVSGYDDFTYAVEMMRHGVCEYILKPVEREKIKAILEKLDKRITDSQKKEENRMKISFQQLRYLIMNEDSSEEEIATLELQYEDQFFQNEYQISCFEADVEDENEDAQHIYLKDLDSQNICLAQPDMQGILLKSKLAEDYVGLSSVHSSLREVREAYLEAYGARKTAFCMEKKLVTSGEPKPQIPEQMLEEAAKLVDDRACLQRVQLLGTDKLPELLNNWNSFFHEVRAGRIDAEVFERVVKQFLAESQKTYRNILESDMEQFQRLQEIWCYPKLEEYQKEFIAWIRVAQDRINNQIDTNKNEQKIQQAVAYIKEHYSDDLNMAVVSNHISMNYSLFSYSFKQYVGSNFVNYLKEIRMEEAKRLLADTDMRVIEISQQVGYDNDKHFMKIFKTYCGVSPSEYRKNMKCQ